MFQYSGKVFTTTDGSAYLDNDLSGTLLYHYPLGKGLNPKRVKTN